MINSYSYLSIKKIAELTGKSERTLKDWCLKNKCSYRKVSAGGGKQGLKYEILVSSLEQELQAKIYSYSIEGNEKIQGNSYEHDALVFLPNTLNGEPYHHLPFNKTGAVQTADSSSCSSKVIPNSAKEIALAKFTLIDYWQNFRKDKQDKKQADKDFLVFYHSGTLNKKLLKTLGKVSIGSLYRWAKTLAENNNNYYSLINNYNYTGEKQLNTSLTDEEKQAFIKLYYNDAQFNLNTAYNILKYKAEQNGIEIKSVATYRRFANFINKNHYDFEVLSRQGEKALKDKVVPSIRRDVSSLQVGDILVADGNKLDFMVINPFTGKSARATMVVFMDWASRDFLGYEIMFSENTQCISSALRNAIIRLGKLPKVVYMDNGRAFRGKYFTGTDSFDSFKGIYAQLGIKTTFAKPYNGKAKIVERSFGDFVQSCPPAISSYIGSSISKQPAHIKRNEKFHKKLHKNDKVPTIEQAKIIIDEWLNFYRSKKLANGQTIQEVFEAGKGTGIDIDMLDELMMSSEIRTLKRSTIKLFGHEYTGSELYGTNTKVLVKYSLFDISKLKVYSLKGEYIGEANTVIKYNAMARYFGSATDIYTLKQAQKAQNALINGSIKKTKLLMSTSPFDDISWANQPQEVAQLEEKRQQKKKYEITGYENAHLYLPQKKRYTIGG